MHFIHVNVCVCAQSVGSARCEYAEDFFTASDTCVLAYLHTQSGGIGAEELGLHPDQAFRRVSLVVRVPQITATEQLIQTVYGPVTSTSTRPRGICGRISGTLSALDQDPSTVQEVHWPGYHEVPNQNGFLGNHSLSAEVDSDHLE